MELDEAEKEAPVLALYDFRSKQQYIYRTNRMREITGASELIARMYGVLLDQPLRCGNIRKEWKHVTVDLFGPDGMPQFLGGEAGIVVYEGGGNLCMLYRSMACCIEANRIFSRTVLNKAYDLAMVMGCAEWVCTGNPEADFVESRKRAYRSLDISKRVGSADPPCNVLPFTQVDPVTYQPIVKKTYQGSDRLDLTRESLCKLNAYQLRAKKEKGWQLQGKFIDEIGTEKCEDSLVAIVYFDGNSIGNRLTERVHSIQDMRDFSIEVHDTLVTKTERAMVNAIRNMPDERQRGYRVIVDHGDEITLICNAHAAPYAIDAYFEAIRGTGYHACAGMAVCHAHDPFASVYRIAEQCCESGKRYNRSRVARGMSDANYVDFHFVRSGITGSMEHVRESQEGRFTKNRPYQSGGSYERFLAVGKFLCARDCGIKRSDLKELNRAILKGDSWYALEYERLSAKDGAAMRAAEEAWLTTTWTGKPADKRHAMRNVLFDVTTMVDVFNVRFCSGTEEGDRHE